MPVFKILTLLIPVARAVGDAVGRRSEGGKRITPSERDEILAAALDALGPVVDTVAEEAPRATRHDVDRHAVR